MVTGLLMVVILYRTSIKDHHVVYPNSVVLIIHSKTREKCSSC